MNDVESLEFEAIENTITIDPYDGFEKLDIVVPERSIIKYKRQSISIYKVCYLERIMGSNPPKACVVRSSICPKRCDLVGKLIKLAKKQPEHMFSRLITAFDWIDQQGKADDVYQGQTALQLYSQLSEELYMEARGSAVRGKARTRSTLTTIQDAAITLIHAATGLSREQIRGSAVTIDRHENYSKNQKRAVSASRMQEAWLLHLRHFDSIANHLLNDIPSPLHVKREDLGYPDYKIWMFKFDSRQLAKAKESGSHNAQFFDQDDEFIFSRDAAKKRAKELGHSRYEGGNHRVFTSNVRDEQGLLRLVLLRRANVHFAHLLLMVSGCNPEQLPYVDFSKRLSNTPDAKKQTAVKPRSGYAEKPVQFSAKFLPTWRKYLKVRDLTLSEIDPDFGPFGIPIPPAYNHKKGERTLKMGTSLVLGEAKSIGLPEGFKPPSLTSGRSNKTINLLDESNGDVGKVSQMLGRDPAVTRKHYAFKAFEDSAKQLDSFFSALTRAASIKAEGYSSAAPIHNNENSYRIHSGRCDADGENASTQPERIQGVNENAPQPRCGAPVTCFFCVHYGHHATVEDINLILSAKMWIQKQTKKVSRNIDEHMSKFLPILERIDDITQSFRDVSDEYDAIYQKALAEIEAGNYSRYWRNKIDAFLYALEID
ncbi:hypothetical protein ACTXGQ_18845 [Marinobacter sp. 1Y8]